MAELPHEYPFRLVERQVGDAVRAGITVSASWLRDEATLPSSLLIEILAQAAILLLPETGQGGRGLLAGIDESRFDERPVEAGEVLNVRMERAGNFGRLAKVHGSIHREDGSLVCEASLLLARDG